MARLWSCGFELQLTATRGEWDTTNGTLAIVTSGQRSGAAALRCNTTAATAYIQHRVMNDATTPAFVRFAIKVGSYPSASCIIHAFGDGTAWNASFRMQTDGTLRMYDTNTAIGVASPAVPIDGNWHMVEIAYDDAGANTMTAKLDGTQFSSATGADLGGWGQIRLGVQSGVTADLYFDDYAINDNTGSVENSYPDIAAKIVHMHPDSAGDVNDWATAVGGTAGQANNYTRVSETVPDDLTTYNQTATANLVDEFNLETSAAVGIGASDTIKLVAVGIRSGSSSTTATNTSVRLKSQASGTTTIVTGVTCNLNGFTTNGNTVPRVHKITAYVDPQAGGAWTPALLDTTQVGYGTPTGTTTRRVTAIWALVEYVPGSGAVTADADLSGTGTLASTATGEKPAAATLSGTGSLAGAATSSKAVDAALSATGTLAGTATSGRNADAALAGSGSLAASGTSTKPAATALAGTGSLVSSSTNSKPVDAALAGTGTLAASTASSKPTDATLAGTGTLTAAASTAKVSAASLAATGTLSSTATVTSSSGADGNLAGTGTLASTTTITKSATAALSGTGSLAASAATTQSASAALVGTAALTGAATATRAAAGNLAATATLTATATATTPTVTIDATLSGTGTLTAGATVTRVANANLNGAISTAATTGSVLSVAGVLAGTGTLTASVDTFDQITLRPFIGISTRPDNGRTIRPYTGTTIRP